MIGLQAANNVKGKRPPKAIGIATDLVRLDSSEGKQALADR